MRVAEETVSRALPQWRAAMWGWIVKTARVRRLVWHLMALYEERYWKVRPQLTGLELEVLRVHTERYRGQRIVLRDKAAKPVIVGDHILRVHWNNRVRNGTREGRMRQTSDDWKRLAQWMKVHSDEGICAITCVGPLGPAMKRLGMQMFYHDSLPFPKRMHQELMLLLHHPDGLDRLLEGRLPPYAEGWFSRRELIEKYC